MKRRSFILGAASFASTIYTGQLYAQTPCPPGLSGASVNECPLPQGSASLSSAAAQLNPGGFSLNPIRQNQNHEKWDVSWQNTSGFWDDMRREMHYMGKGQNLRPAKHFIYNEESDTWRYTSLNITEVDAYGHIWGVCFDDFTGNCYFAEQDIGSRLPNTVRYMDRSVEAGQGSTNSPWTTLPNASLAEDVHESGSFQAGLGFHPNLMGPGKPGLYVGAAFGVRYCDIINGKWYRHDGMYNKANGPSVYVPGHDVLVQSSGRKDDVIMWLIRAGEPDLEADSITPPIGVFSHTNNHGKLMLDPRDTEQKTIMLLESKGSTVWTSDDLGSTWTTESFAHPFWTEGIARSFVNSSDGGSWAPCSILRYGIVLAHCSNGQADVHNMIMWRPG